MEDTNQDISALKEYIQKLTKEVENLSKSVYVNKVYTNNDLMKLLGVSGKLIKLYRDSRLLPFHSVRDKYWYTQKDIDTFMQRTAVQ